RALGAPSLKRHAPPRVYPNRTRPDRALTVLEKGRHLLARELRILREVARLPAREAGVGANPQRSVARREQRVNRTRGERLVSGRLPRDGPDAVKADETEFGAEPEITVRRLGDGVDGPFENAF